MPLKILLAIIRSFIHALFRNGGFGELLIDYT